jgi:RTX calcium-binding nonapeptide repeat (4 copies)
MNTPVHISWLAEALEQSERRAGHERHRCHLPSTTMLACTVIDILSSSPLKKEIGMRRTFLLLVSAAVALLLASGAVLALPSEKPDHTPMVDGRVRAIEQVGTNIWLGGRFSRVEQRNGRLLGNVANVAVFDSKTEEYRKGVAPRLGGTGSEVFDMTLYGDDVLIAGKFAGPSSTQKNLVLVDGKTGRVIQWYNSPSLKSVLAAPDLGRIYAGGVSLSAFERSGTKLWTKAKTTVDPTIRPHDSSPAYRDLELDGQTIWAACICDKVGGKAAKALVKLDTEGNHDASWLTRAGTEAFGLSVVDHNGKLFLGAGGGDFVAELDKGAGGKRSWVRDTSGSAQAVEVYDGQLVVGGHFYYVGDDKTDNQSGVCGFGRPGEPQLDPNGECQRRQGIAAYSFGGRLDPNWHPAYAGSYSLVWDMHVEGLRLHTGGEFKTVSGVVQNSYARLSPASIKGNNRANTLVGTPNDEAIYGYGGDDRIHAWGGNDTLRLGSSKDKGQGGRGNDYLRGVDGSKDEIFCGPGSDRVKANPGDNVTGGCERVTRAGKRVG